MPPTFLTAAEFTVFPQVIGDPELGLDFTQVVHGTQEYVFHRPLRIGETLMVQPRIASIRHKGGNGFLVIETQMRGVDGRGRCRRPFHHDRTGAGPMSARFDGHPRRGRAPGALTHRDP